MTVSSAGISWRTQSDYSIQLHVITFYQIIIIIVIKIGIISNVISNMYNNVIAICQCYD